MTKLVVMFLSFFKIGAFTFGGGYAMIPLIEREVVDTKQWITKEEFTDILVISQSFPGAMPVNSSLFIGYKLGGIIGATMALLGVILPSFLIILVIGMFFERFRDIRAVDNIFMGITGAVPVLVLLAVESLSKSINKTMINLLIIVLTVVAISVFDIHPVAIISASAIYGILSSREPKGTLEEKVGE